MAYQSLTVQQLSSILQRDDAVLVDIRDERSFHHAHIPGAHLATDQTVMRLIGKRQTDRPIVVYCYRGNSSVDFCLLLSGFGFTRLYNLEGGWHAWQSAHTQPSQTAFATGMLSMRLELEGFDL